MPVVLGVWGAPCRIRRDLGGGAGLWGPWAQARGHWKPPPSPEGPPRMCQVSLPLVSPGGATAQCCPPPRSRKTDSETRLTRARAWGLQAYCGGSPGCPSPAQHPCCPPNPGSGQLEVWESLHCLAQDLGARPGAVHGFLAVPSSCWCRFSLRRSIRNCLEIKSVPTVAGTDRARDGLRGCVCVLGP